MPTQLLIELVVQLAPLPMQDGKRLLQIRGELPFDFFLFWQGRVIQRLDLLLQLELLQASVGNAFLQVHVRLGLRQAFLLLIQHP